MRTLKALNTLALAIPVVVAVFGIIDAAFLMYALMSTMATGFIQVGVGLFLWSERPTYIPIIAYLLLVAVFFSLWRFTDYNWIWVMPPTLCGYLSILVYSQKPEL